MRWTFLLISLIVFTGCGGDDSPVSTDTTAPTVVSTSPVDNADEVAVDTIIEVSFSEDMNPSTIAASTFLISDGVVGAVSYGSRKAAFRPSSNLEENFTYMATVTSAVKDEAGNSLAENFVWTFTTEGDAIMPLGIDNTWTARNTSYDIYGNELFSSTATMLIVRDTIISGDRWYIDQSDMLYANRADGLYRRNSQNRTYLFLKYPAAVDQAYAGDPDASETLVVKSVDTSITVAAGTYLCHMYESRKSGELATVHYYYALDIGPIRFNTYWNADEDPLVLKASWELQSLELQ